jgi:adenylosuccinate synthase
MRVRPRYELTANGNVSDSDDKADAHLRFIEEELGAPVKLVSFGPTARDKRQR